MPYAVEQDGFAIAQGVVGESECRILLDALGDLQGAGARGVLAVPAVREFARSEAIESLVSEHFSAPSRPVRAIYFDKSTAANWLVPWHQDLTIAVASKCEAPGFGAWSVKDGIPHVQPPDELLKQMIALRLHFDYCDASNGALRVIPGSHKFGRLNPDQISAVRLASAEVVCEASAGDALLMRPLLLHASSKSVSDRRRRILHIEYCCGKLPAGMTWHDAV